MSRRLRARPYAGLRADPDTAVIDRMAGLTAAATAALSGRAGTIVGYDRGDPAHSFTGPVVAQAQPAAAVGTLGARNAIITTPMATDTLSANPDLDPYNTALLTRMYSRR